MKIDFAFLCQTAKRDEKGKIDAQGLAPCYYVSKVPARLRPATFVMLIRPERLQEPSPELIRVEMLGPDGPVNSASIPFRADTEPILADGPFFWICRMEDAFFPSYGQYEYRFWEGDRLLTVVPIEINHAPRDRPGPTGS